METQQCRLACRLSELNAGEFATLDRLELEPDHAARIMRLGLTPGRKIALLKSGTRFLVATAAARIALDSRFAAGIYVVKDR